MLSQFPPGPPPRSGGPIDTAITLVDMFADPLEWVSARFRRYGDVYYVPASKLTGAPLYAIRHPEHLHDVLVANSASYSKRHSLMDLLKKVLGTGLLTADGDVWMRHRRMVGPAFSKKRMAEYAATMIEESEHTARAWEQGGVHDVSHDMMELTLRVVCRALFGHDVRGETGDVAFAMNAFHEAVSSPDLLPQWLPTPRRMRLKSALERLDAIIYGMIEGRRASGGDNGNDLLGLLLSAVDEEGDGGRLTVQEVRDELVTLFLAGHETTAQTLSWTFYALAANPHVERALHAELDTVLAGRAPTQADLTADRLPYTVQVIKESMRMYPPAYILVRRAEEDTTIGRWPVPAGAEVVLWTYFTHHDPRWYPSPELFRPERFAPDAEEELPQCAYLPFGAGPRACIGRAFAMLEAPLLLAALASRFRPTLLPGARVELQPRITLSPKGGLRMRITPRPGPGRPRPGPA